MTRAQKLDAAGLTCLFGFLTIRNGDQAWNYVAWQNTFMHCLGTVIFDALCSACIAAILFGIYYLFTQAWEGWGRLLVIPWLLISRWIYPTILARDWPQTNTDIEGTAAFFSLIAAALAIPIALLVIAFVPAVLYYSLNGLRVRFGRAALFLIGGMSLYRSGSRSTNPPK